ARAALAALLLAVAAVGPLGPSARAAAEPPLPLGADPRFPLPASLRPAVEFWIAIFTRYTTDQTVLHDSERLDVVHAVLDFADLAGRATSEAQRASLRAAAEEFEKGVVRERLRRLALDADRPERLTPEERRLVARFPSDPLRVTGAALLDAADRVRAQVGQRDRFLQGLAVSGRYLPEMERIFEQEGVPVELTRLAFVESMFNLEARSSAGASGVWQFLRSTGRRYLLLINDLVDERNDPLLAARAAARMLADDYAELGTWPLAITAYNHGKYGVLRAVAETGTRDIGRIVAEYRGPGFGFASRNFYAEFLAALHVERHAERYFGPVPRQAPALYDLVTMPGTLTVPELARLARLDPQELRALNPGLTPQALAGRRPLPAGYALRVPADRRAPLAA
ncbi:MAG TPA: transglycosylase SLT domain-containing protein, partial [Thermodesulfobacteriota bacterium]|nr:transglycosylase SLT domain-containing protein [Thermodesulfobacteriota bacterium]